MRVKDRRTNGRTQVDRVGVGLVHRQRALSLTAGASPRSNSTAVPPPVPLLRTRKKKRRRTKRRKKMKRRRKKSSFRLIDVSAPTPDRFAIGAWRLVH